MRLSYEYDRSYWPAFPVLELTITGAEIELQRTVQGLIDSGSDATQIPASMLRSIGARETDQRWVRDLSGIRYPVEMYTVQIAIGSLVLPGMEVVGRERTNEIIIGRDVLNQMVVTMNDLAHVTELEVY
jgi:hypothetical protein